MSVHSNTITTVPHTSLFVPHALGRLSVDYDGCNFVVVNSAHLRSFVSEEDLSKELRGISIDTLKKVLDVGYLSVRKTGENYALQLNGRLRGGGPIAGAIGYWVTKTVCYGTALGALGGAVAATGGGALGIIGSAVVGAAETTAAVGALSAGIAASAAATAVATEATIGVVGSLGAAGAIAGVETASTAVGTFLTLCPFLP